MKKKIIISGGGTGGHIFPAISIANALKSIDNSIEILFVGAKGKIEMEKVPAAGYPIEGLPVSGLVRRLSFKNFSFLFRLLASINKSKRIIKKFAPDAVVGVGGYASGPLLYAATAKKIPALVQEQNSYAGLTNRLLAKRASKICVAYDKMERFFPKNKIIFTGNPVRKNLSIENQNREEALKFFQLDTNKKTILILGGSGGARTLNESILDNLELIKENKDIQFILQTGKYYYETVIERTQNLNLENLKVSAFISEMNFAYAAADIVISRAGAGTISELAIVGKPVIFVPSPNVAADHQNQNTLALVNDDAAILVKDVEARQTLVKEAIALVKDEEKQNKLIENIKKKAMPDADMVIAKEILKMIKV